MKKVFTTIAAVAALAATSATSTTAYATDTPAISVSIVGDTIINGDSAEYTIIYEGDVSLVTISEKSVGLEGFSADKSVTVNDDNTVNLTLTNIIDTKGENAIHIGGGTAVFFEDGDIDKKTVAKEATLEKITIINSDNPNTGVTIPIVSTIISALSALALRKRNK